MRVAVISVLAGGVLSAGIAAAEPCARPADLAAFGVAGLKTHLMVVALSCSQQDRYNDFVHRFQGELVSHERALNAYFARAFGGRAQAMHDDYITSLANTQSESGIHQGTLFCRQNVGMFDEVMALAKGGLASYAAGKVLDQPMELVACPTEVRTAQATTKRQ